MGSNRLPQTIPAGRSAATGTSLACMRFTPDPSSERLALEDLQDFFFMRVNRLAPEKTHPGYAGMLEQERRRYLVCRAPLPRDAAQILEDLRRLLAILATMAMEIAYRRGLADILQIAVWSMSCAPEEQTRPAAHRLP